MEEAFIKSLDAVDCGLNCTYGSEGGMAGYEYSDASKKKMSDKAKAGNRSVGEKNPKAKLKEAQVKAIKY